MGKRTPLFPRVSSTTNSTIVPADAIHFQSRGTVLNQWREIPFASSSYRPLRPRPQAPYRPSPCTNKAIAYAGGPRKSFLNSNSTFKGAPDLSPGAPGPCDVNKSLFKVQNGYCWTRRSLCSSHTTGVGHNTTEKRRLTVLRRLQYIEKKSSSSSRHCGFSEATR